jgi:CRP-like cAMP-binding protein
MIERDEILRHCPVLSGFTDVGIKILSTIARERIFTNAQPLQVQGEVAKDEGVLFLANGRVRCAVRDENDRVFGLGTLTAGDHLGGMRLFQSAPSPVNAIAEGEVLALLIDRVAFERLRRQKPQAAMKLLMALSSDFGRHLAESAPLFAQFCVFAAQRINIEERGAVATFSQFGMEPTPTLK